MNDERVTGLFQALDSSRVLTDSHIIEGYRFDRAREMEAGTPLAVVRATCTEDVQSVMQWATRHRVPVVPRGAGTGLSGGATAVDGGVVLSLERLTAIDIDPRSRLAHVGAGAINKAVKAAAAEFGLWYPPDPSSFDTSTIGGNIATNAGGLCCSKYGVTENYVVRLDVVMSDGRAVRLGKGLRKDAAGLSLLKLLIGSEGTLGVITGATLRLVPLATDIATVVGTFPTVEAATRAVVQVCASTSPSMLELLDNVAIVAVDDMTRMGLDRTAGAMLMAQSDADAEQARHEASIIDRAFRACDATEVYMTTERAESEAFVTARRQALPAVESMGDLLLEDVGVPVSEMPKLVSGIQRIADENALSIAIIAHAGDGNTHPLIVYDAQSVAESARARRAFDSIMQLALALGGTITGEHGVGRLKRDWLPASLGDEAIAITRQIKHALDPFTILNPGAVLPVSN